MFRHKQETTLNRQPLTRICRNTRSHRMCSGSQLGSFDRTQTRRKISSARFLTQKHLLKLTGGPGRFPMVAHSPPPSKFFPSVPSRSAIRKRSPAGCDLVGRRVQVPQRFTDVPDDGDGFCFGATIIVGDAKRVTLCYDYTGEVEQWPRDMANQWLEPDTDPLCNALERLSHSLVNDGRSVIPV